jgi:hypothetical protein
MGTIVSGRVGQRLKIRMQVARCGDIKFHVGSIQLPSSAPHSKLTYRASDISRRK